ncbi:uncharacterized protein [Nicotiana sylvestris]|uniref:uncharacterized protein n=1 Tax=Nicotiana sylvestris TaxID=4096 RepID=UPI00388C6B5D
MGLLQPVPPNRQNLESPSYRLGTRCAYHSGVEGHNTEDCWTLKKAVENLIEQKWVVLRDEEVPNVTNNPLPAHNNGSFIGMICEDKEFDPALKAIIAIIDVEKKPKAPAKQDKDEKKSSSTPQSIEKVVETKTGATPHKDVVLYVPRAPRKEQFVLSPPKRFEQNKVTLKRMEIGTERIRPNNVCLRAFDGVKRDTIGEIDLILTIGPVDFEVTFQVLDMDTSYNFLLGRPWIHAAGAIPSMLHQMVKFDHEIREIVFHGEDE